MTLYFSWVQNTHTFCHFSKLSSLFLSKLEGDTAETLDISKLSFGYWDKCWGGVSSLLSPQLVKYPCMFHSMVTAHIRLTFRVECLYNKRQIVV